MTEAKAEIKSWCWSFRSTGNYYIDKVLESVAASATRNCDARDWAASHDKKPSCVDEIQAAADRAAERIIFK